MKRISFLLFCLGFLCSCNVNYLSQDSYLSRSKDGKDLYYLCIFEGIYASGELDKAKEEIEGYVSSGDSFVFPIFAQGPFYLSIQGFKQELEDAKEKNAAFKWMSFVVENTEVANGNLYQDNSTGRLCGFQVIRIQNVDEFIRLSNRGLCEMIVKDKPSTKTYPLTTQNLFLTAQKGEWEPLDLNGTSLKIEVPIDPNEAGTMKSDFMKGLFKEMIEDTPSTYTLLSIQNSVSKNILSFIQKEKSFSLIHGDPEMRTNRIFVCDDSELSEKQLKNLVPWASRQKAWNPEIKTIAIIEEFKKAPEQFFEKTFRQNKKRVPPESFQRMK